LCFIALNLGLPRPRRAIAIRRLLNQALGKKGDAVDGVESTIVPLLRRMETQLAALYARVVGDLDLRKELLLLHDRVVKLERRVEELERPKGRRARRR
jgi:hypothetical protein